MTVRVNRVVQLGPDRASLEPHARLLLGCHALLVGVLFGVETGTATQSRCRSRRADVLQDRLVTDQRLARPVGADPPEQPVLDRVPLRRPRRVVRDRDHQAQLIGQPLQRHLPPPLPTVRGPAAVRLDQQPPRLRVAPTADIQPPTPDGRRREAAALSSVTRLSASSCACLSIAAPSPQDKTEEARRRLLRANRSLPVGVRPAKNKTKILPP